MINTDPNHIRLRKGIIDIVKAYNGGKVDLECIDRLMTLFLKEKNMFSWTAGMKDNKE